MSLAILLSCYHAPVCMEWDDCGCSSVTIDMQITYIYPLSFLPLYQDYFMFRDADLLGKFDSS